MVLHLSECQMTHCYMNIIEILDFHERIYPGGMASRWGVAAGGSCIVWSSPV
jgi:hypothetical protein